MKYLGILLLAFVLLSCGDSVDIPEGVIKPETMVPLLVDMHKADEEKKLQMQSYPDSTRMDTVNYIEIFSRHGVSKQMYDSSMKFYAANPVLFNSIYDQVLHQLNLEHSEVQSGKR